MDACASSNPCQNGATCSSSGPGGAAECACPPGWAGAHCGADVNECAGEAPGGNPCAHGRCQNFKGGYQCACEDGWSGRDCDVDSDDCASAPCRAGSTCRRVQVQLRITITY